VLAKPLQQQACQSSTLKRPWLVNKLISATLL